MINSSQGSRKIAEIIHVEGCSAMNVIAFEIKEELRIRYRHVVYVRNLVYESVFVSEKILPTNWIA
jgi:hypothetical protein